MIKEFKDFVRIAYSDDVKQLNSIIDSQVQNYQFENFDYSRFKGFIIPYTELLTQANVMGASYSFVSHTKKFVRNIVLVLNGKERGGENYSKFKAINGDLDIGSNYTKASMDSNLFEIDKNLKNRLDIEVQLLFIKRVFGNVKIAPVFIFDDQFDPLGIIDLLDEDTIFIASTNLFSGLNFSNAENSLNQINEQILDNLYEGNNKVLNLVNKMSIKNHLKVRNIILTDSSKFTKVKENVIGYGCYGYYF